MTIFIHLTITMLEVPIYFPPPWMLKLIKSQWKETLGGRAQCSTAPFSSPCGQEGCCLALPSAGAHATGMKNIHYPKHPVRLLYRTRSSEEESGLFQHYSSFITPPWKSSTREVQVILISDAFKHVILSLMQYLDGPSTKCCVNNKQSHLFYCKGRKTSHFNV